MFSFILISCSLLLIGKVHKVGAMDCYEQPGFVPGALPSHNEFAGYSSNIFTCPERSTEVGPILPVPSPASILSVL